MSPQKITELRSIRGSVRPVIEQLKPELNSGRYPIKRVQNDSVSIDATVILDGHDLLACELLYKHERDRDWTRVRMKQTVPGRDLWNGSFLVPKMGQYIYTVQAWVDHFETWKNGLKKKSDAGQDVSVELRIGALLIKQAARRAQGPDSTRLTRYLKFLGDTSMPNTEKVNRVQEAELSSLMAKCPDRRLATTYERELRITVDRKRAQFSAWYEFFPRSVSKKPGAHGTFKDCEKMLPYISGMGFDVVYLPPIHPIGKAFRKGKNNSLAAEPKDPGSPWGIGGKAGGHKSVHPELGSIRDFRRFLKKAEEHGLEVALDIAFQCSPDHPYVKQHPEWFKKLPDGTIQYAENPPKKYQDIYPFHFESAEWAPLWLELKGVIRFWIKNGVKIFRVDNPHTKPFGFWNWLIAEIKKDHPEVLFLSEAFTRPAMMYHLAKIGFTQSYTYFTWRNTPTEFKKYLEELTQTEVSEFYRPNFWPNTPDILPLHLQTGGRPAFLTRVALAGTLSSNFGIYGPAYELGENVPFKEGGEEYLNSEKYEIRHWDLASPKSIRDFISRLNRIRKENPALHGSRNIQFHPAHNDHVLCFTKHTDDLSNIILVVANLDFHKTQTARIELPLESFGFNIRSSYKVTDLVSDRPFTWKGRTQKLQLPPSSRPVTIFRIQKQ